jgi:hypothetical protein
MAKTDFPKDVTLPSGGTATILRKAKGQDLEKAYTAVGKRHKNHVSMAMALAAQVIHVNGSPVVYEELQDMDIDDVSAILAELNGSEEESPLA